jgi:hypothetical protein
MQQIFINIVNLIIVIVWGCLLINYILNYKKYNDKYSVLKKIGYTAKYLKDSGYTVLQLKNAGYTLKELIDAGYTAEELKDAGFNI